MRGEKEGVHPIGGEIKTGGSLAFSLISIQWHRRRPSLFHHAFTYFVNFLFSLSLIIQTMRGEYIVPFVEFVYPLLIQREVGTL